MEFIPAIFTIIFWAVWLVLTRRAVEALENISEAFSAYVRLAEQKQEHTPET